ncbi:MAG TPA: hypothetical protein VF077_13095 [Nitrospiraceae bacterium]
MSDANEFKTDAVEAIPDRIILRAQLAAVIFNLVTPAAPDDMIKTAVRWAERLLTESEKMGNGEKV